MVTIFMALGTNLSALWISVANGWMQNPVGAVFNFETMRMEMTSFLEVVLQPRCAKQIRAHRIGRLCGGLHVCVVDFQLVYLA